MLLNITPTPTSRSNFNQHVHMLTDMYLQSTLYRMSVSGCIPSVSCFPLNCTQGFYSNPTIGGCLPCPTGTTSNPPALNITSCFRVTLPHHHPHHNEYLDNLSNQILIKNTALGVVVAVLVLVLLACIVHFLADGSAGNNNMQRRITLDQLPRYSTTISLLESSSSNIAKKTRDPLHAILEQTQCDNV